MRSWGRSARGGGAAARNAPPGLAPRPPAALAASRRALSLRASLPVLARLAARPPPPAAPPSTSARSLSLLLVVTKHYKKAGRAVPGIGGRGAAAGYIPASTASAAAPTWTSRAAAAAAATPTPPAARPASSRRGPSPRPRPSGPGTLRGQGGRPGEARGTRARGPFVDFTAANIWAQRGPPLVAAPPPRLGDRRRRSPKAGDFGLGPGRKEGRGVEGWGLASPGSSSRFPLPFQGHSRQGGDGVGCGADGSRRSQVPGIPRLGPWGFSSPLPTPLPRISLSVPAARGHRTERRPESPGGLCRSPPRPRSWRPNFRARVSYSAPSQCALGKGLAGAGRVPPGAWVGTGVQAGASGTGVALAARRRQGSRGWPGALECSGHSRGTRLPPRSPPGCDSCRCAEAAEQLQPPPPPPSKSTLAPCAMVTHSKFPAAGMSRPLDTSLRLKTFSSKSEYQLVVNAVRKLQESGFYWSAVTGGEANLLLSAEPAGTFLIRDSSDQRHFFTLSVKTQSGTKNLRIQCEGGSFSLQSDPRSSQPVPRFDCVLKLVHHYMPPPGAPSLPSPPTEPSSEEPEQPPAQPLPGNPPRRAYYIYSGGEKIPLVLSRPLSSNVATLQHLCRKTVNGHLDCYEKVTQLPGPIREFLDQYDAPL